MRGGFSTCTETCGSGVTIGLMIPTMSEVQLAIHLDWVLAFIVFTEGEVATIRRKNAAHHTEFLTPPIIGIGLLVFEL